MTYKMREPLVLQQCALCMAPSPLMAAFDSGQFAAPVYVENNSSGHAINITEHQK